MNVIIEKSVAKGIIEAPPSKSYAHRLLICGFLSNDSIIHNISFSNDITATLNILKSLGASYELDNSTVRIKRNNIFKEEFDAGESGSTLRFLIPLILFIKGEGTIYGSKKLFSRGLGIYEEIFKKQNIKYELNEDSIYIKGRLSPGRYEIPANISSQFISGLLFILPLFDVDSEIILTEEIESINYIDMTIEAMDMFGVKVIRKDNIIHIPGNQNYLSKEVTVEGDYSNSSFFEMLNYLGGEVIIKGLNPLSKQGDKAYLEYFPLLRDGHPIIDIKNMIDLGPILFAFASIFNGAKFINIKRLRIKESDRVNDTLSILSKFGIKYVLNDNELEIFKSELSSPMEAINIYNDHRLVMMTAILLTKFSGKILNVEAVNKSFPDFFKKLSSLGIGVKYED